MTCSQRCNFLWYRPEGIENPPLNSSEGQNFSVKSATWEVVNEAKSTEFPSYIGRYSVESVEAWTQRLLKMEIVQVDDLNTETDNRLQDLEIPLSLTSSLSLPIQTQSGEIGVLFCGHHSYIRKWEAEEVALLQAVTTQLAIAIDQAELYSQMRQIAFQAQAQAEQLEKTLQQLRKTQTHLIQTEKMSSLGQMVAGIAHEINNPVNFIYGNLIHLRDYTSELLQLVNLYRRVYPTPVPQVQEEIERIDLEFLSQDLPKMLSSMRVGTERIRQIVLSLRNFSRLDEAEVKAVDIHEGIDNTLLILQNRLKEKAGQPAIEVVKEYGKLPQIECFAGQLNQVFMNLIANAIDALQESTPPTETQSLIPTHQAHSKNLELFKLEESAIGLTRKGHQAPTLCIRTEIINGDWIAIRIADNGPGMPEGVRNRLFDPFFTTKAVGKGTGLGLSISYQIVVEKHGGKLYCISIPGEGTEFTVEIPVRQPIKSFADLPIKAI